MSVALGSLLKTAEGAFGGVWSLGELAVAISRFEEIRRDPHRQAVNEDIARRGWYVPVSPPDLRRKGDWVVADNPYQRIGTQKRERVVAKMVPAKHGDARHLVVVCHCYGVPVPPVMAWLFGLSQARHVDVAYNIMNHHQWGTYPAWPGSGFVSGRLSHMLENLRSSITGVRALIAGLRAARAYDKVTVVGFSIGGQLAFHLANSAPVDQAVLYCPVVSLHRTAQELGFMRWLHAPVSAAMRRWKGEFALDDLAVADPLNHPLGIEARDLHVIVQRFDALATVAQIEPIRERYPAANWHEYDGTHVVPAGAADFRRRILSLLQ